jgi:manganese/zinc/iron transport system substrate-binding protein
VRVESLLGEGVDPHTYKLTRTDMARLAGADSVFSSGLHLEGKMTEVLERLGQEPGGAGGGKLVVEVGLKLPADRILRPDGAAGEADPHYWMDPELFALASTAMAEALAVRMPEHASGVQQGAERYRGEIQRLADYAKDAFGKVPEAKRTLITSHDAFGYLGRAFGLRVLAVQGISTESEAGVRDIERLVERVVSEKVTAVFVETSVPDRTLRAVVAGAASRGHTVSIGGTLFSDAMGAPGTYTGTWIGMMDHNITTIARALGAEVPAAGMAGKLAASATGGGK